MNEITPKKTRKPRAPKASAAAPLPAPHISSEQIAHLAYLIWEQEGRPSGREQEHWLQAESQLKASLIP